jgi:hypothetical protein
VGGGRALLDEAAQSQGSRALLFNKLVHQLETQRQSRSGSFAS